MFYMAMFLPVLTLLPGCGGKAADGGQESAYVVRVDTARGEVAGQVLQFPGRVVPVTEVNVSFKVAGRLKKVYVKEGDAVRAGQLLAELDPIDYETQLQATEAEYEQVKADAERIMGLYGEGGTTASNNDKARYGLKQMEAKLRHHRTQLADTRVFAPFGGVVQSRHFEGGEMVAAGMPVVTMQSAGGLEVEVSLPAVSYLHRADFSDYSCTLDVAPGEVYGLNFVSVTPKANANQLYTMRLRFADAGRDIAPGMSAWVSISMAAPGSGLVRVPATAVFERDGKSCVYIYDKASQTVRAAAVSISSVHTDGSVLVADSVEDGALVVTSGVHHIRDGARVKLLPPMSPTNVGGLL